MQPKNRVGSNEYRISLLSSVYWQYRLFPDHARTFCAEGRGEECWHTAQGRFLGTLGPVRVRSHVPGPTVSRASGTVP